MISSLGKLIVFEGTDGSGKKTQSELLFNFLQQQIIQSHYIDFPRYHDSFYGELCGRFLNGEFGALDEVDPHLVAMMLALDRMSAKQVLEEWLQSGSIIVANRYATSNMAHQTAKLPVEKREVFLEWLQQMEYEENGIPREDVVVFLYLPGSYTQKTLLQKGRRTYVQDKLLDIAEANLEHQQMAEQMYLELSRRFEHWVSIDCLDNHGKFKTREEIHGEIKSRLADRGFIPYAEESQALQTSLMMK